VHHDILVGAELDALRGKDLTYAEVGQTRGVAPRGYHHLRRSRVVGTGLDRFEEASRALLGWQMHRRAGVAVRPSSKVVVEGAFAVLRLGWTRLGLNAPVRMVYVIDEDHRTGFAYGTLPGHPESGEEAFVVELLDDEQVLFTISAFSRSTSLLAKLAGPISSAVQSWVTNRYLHAL
jgi:uncharacterized protein (UPF0548 family)